VLKLFFVFFVVTLLSSGTLMFLGFPPVAREVDAAARVDLDTLGTQSAALPFDRSVASLGDPTRCVDHAMPGQAAPAREGREHASDQPRAPR